MLCGAGFTMSLFLGALAVSASADVALSTIRLAVLAASVMSVLMGAILPSLAPSAFTEREE